MLRLRFWLLLLTNALIAQALPTQERRDADFASIRTELTHGRSGKRRDPLDKYFHESTVSPSLSLSPPLPSPSPHLFLPTHPLMPPSSTRTMMAASPPPSSLKSNANQP